MKRFFMMMCVFLLLLSGCASPVKPKYTVNPPPKPHLPLSELTAELDNYRASLSAVRFAPPTTLNVNLIPEDGVNNKTIDNVSVRVESILDMIDEADFTTTIDAPDGYEYTYSIFPMVLVLDIHNGTDHIIRLEKTIIYLEDDKQKEYPLVSDFNNSKTNLLSNLNKSFDDYIENNKNKINTEKIEQKYIDEWFHTVFTEYVHKYNEMVSEVKSALNKGMAIRRTGMPAKEALGRDDLYLALYKPYSPDEIFQFGKKYIIKTAKQYASGNNVDIENVEELRKLALDKINKIDVNNLNYSFITHGTYLPISILPGRSKKIYAPIARKISDETIKNVIIGVYDLPTRVDNAGNTTKRANFVFKYYSERI